MSVELDLSARPSVVNWQFGNVYGSLKTTSPWVIFEFNHSRLIMPIPNNYISCDSIYQGVTLRAIYNVLPNDIYALEASTGVAGRVGG